MAHFSQLARDKLRAWLRQGISPLRLAITLALGFSIGCLPIIGIPTALCFLVAFALRLNLPALQAANYVAFPVQLALALPLVRLGNWLMTHITGQEYTMVPSERMLYSPEGLSTILSGMLSHALLGWLITVVPAAALLTLVLWSIAK